MAWLTFAAEYSRYWIVAMLGMPFLLTYLITSRLASDASHSSRKDTRPPLVPYWIPFLGHALEFFHDTGAVARLTAASRPGIARLQLANKSINFVTGSENITALWRSKGLDAKVVTCFSLRQFFDTPKRAMRIYHADNSGINPHPRAGDETPTKDRYYYLNRKHTFGFFNGPGLKHFGNRFGALLTREIEKLEVCNSWVGQEDLYAFVQNLLIGPAVEAMCGPALLERSPCFSRDFWKFDHDMYYFFKGYPRFLIPRALKNRNRVLSSLKDWHSHARDNFDESCIEPDGHDRFHGSPLMRSRHDFLPKISGLDADALASQDLGLIWAENANSIPAVFWMIVEALRNPHLLSHALGEIVTSQSWSQLQSNPSIDVSSLCNMPTLQAMFAETLRLYTSLFALRSVAHGDFSLGGHAIPKDDLVAADTRVAAMDRNIWNDGSTTTAQEAVHPLDQFWAERFLVDREDPKSGPLRINTSSSTGPAARLPCESDNKGPQFTTDGLAGAWLPFGGGTRLCPGRSFAKQEMILAFSTIFCMLDIELLNGDGMASSPKPNLKYYGLGTLPPKDKVPFRVRRRE